VTIDEYRAATARALDEGIRLGYVEGRDGRYRDIVVKDEAGSPAFAGYDEFVDYLARRAAATRARGGGAGRATEVIGGDVDEAARQVGEANDRWEHRIPDPVGVGGTSVVKAGLLWVRRLRPQRARRHRRRDDPGRPSRVARPGAVLEDAQTGWRGAGQRPWARHAGGTAMADLRMTVAAVIRDAEGRPVMVAIPGALEARPHQAGDTLSLPVGVI